MARPYAIPQGHSNTIGEVLQAEDQSGQSSLAAGEASAAAQRREALKELFARTQVCTRCAELASTRRKVVFGSGHADADLMFVGEAPGASEDEQGLPFVGQAGRLLEKLLGEIGMARSDVFIANVLKCRPPGNRDPVAAEIDNCREYLLEQVALVQPRVLCTLGNFATKLLRDDPAGITRVHGRAEVVTLGRRTLRLYPIYHPAAALYTPRMLETLREDFAALPGLLALALPEQPTRMPDGDGEGAVDPVGVRGEAPGATPRAPASGPTSAPASGPTSAHSSATAAGDPGGPRDRADLGGDLAGAASAGGAAQRDPAGAADTAGVANQLGLF